MALATSSSSLSSVTATRPQATHKNNGIAFSASWSIQHVMCACPMQLGLGSTHNNPLRIADMVNASLTHFNERFAFRFCQPTGRFESQTTKQKRSPHGDPSEFYIVVAVTQRVVLLSSSYANRASLKQLPPKEDSGPIKRNVCFGPIADVPPFIRIAKSGE